MFVKEICLRGFLKSPGSSVSSCSHVTDSSYRTALDSEGGAHLVSQKEFLELKCAVRTRQNPGSSADSSGKCEKVPL